jgi:hypothetical protein
MLAFPITELAVTFVTVVGLLIRSGTNYPDGITLHWNNALQEISLTGIV